MKMSGKTTLKIGFSGLVLSPIRLILTILLSAIALGLFGAAISAYRFSEDSARREVLFASDYLLYGDISAESYGELSKLSCGGVVALYSMGGGFYDYYEFFNDLPERTDGCMTTSPQYAAHVDESFISAQNLKVTGRLPENAGEIAVSSCVANAFIKFGYFDYVNYPYDIIADERGGEGGRSVSSYEEFTDGSFYLAFTYPDGTYCNAAVVGVIDDGCTYDHTDEEYFEPSDFHDKIYISAEAIEKFYGGYIFGVGSGYSEALEDYYLFVENGEDYFFTSDELNELVDQISTLEGMRTAFLSVGIALAAFSAILIYQFISFSIQGKKGEIAILRALGASKSDVLCVYLLESVMLSLFSSAAAAVLGGVLATSVNASFSSLIKGIVFLRFDIFIVCLIFGLSIIISLLSAIIPILKTASKSPVEAIRENQE